MITDDTYTSLAVARCLQRCGEWGAALALLAEQPDAAAAELRAQILVDRHWWRLDDPAPAQAAVDALTPDTPRSRYLRAQLAYTRMLFNRGPVPDDAQTATAGFEAAAQDEALRAWGVFWLGVLADNVHDDPTTAKTRYDEALELCRKDDDPLLESYVVRHLGDHAMPHDRTQGELMLRRSLHLRSALGARPLVAAAQAALAGELPAGPERETLYATARATAEELGLTWLKGALANH